MAIITTSNLGLNLPSKGEQNWDTLINQNMDKIDNEINNRKNEINTINTQLADKAADTDNNRTTTSKTVTGAINELKLQANINETNITANTNAIANIGNASPKGTYTTLTALQTAYPTGATGIYIVTADGGWYYWNNSAWTKGGNYQSSGIAKDSITTDNLQSNLLKKITPNAIDFTNKTSIFGGVYNSAIANIPLLYDGYISVNISCSDAGTIQIFIANNNNGIFTIKNIANFNVTKGTQTIFTGFYSVGNGNEYVGIQNNSNNVVQFGYDSLCGYYGNTSIGRSLIIGDSFNFTQNTSITFAFYPIIERISIPQNSVDKNSINNNCIDILKLDKDLKEYYSFNSYDISNCNSLFGESLSYAIIPNIPITKAGYLVLSIKINKVVNLPIVLFTSNRDGTFKIKDYQFISFTTTGLQNVEVLMNADGDGTEYLGFIQTISQSVMYSSTNPIGYYQSNSVVSLQDTDNIAFNLKTNATFAFIPMIEILSFDTDTLPTYGARWKGKNSAHIGDSITAGMMYDATHNLLGISPFTQYLTKLLGINNAQNLGLGGDSLVNFNLRYTNINSNTDVISVWGGVNDFDNGVALGKMNDSTTTTFYGAVDYLIKNITATYPSATLFFITPPKITYTHDCLTLNSAGYNLLDYVNAIKQVCDKYSVPVLDMYSNGGISPYLPTHIGYLTNDGCHPTALGYEIYANKIAAFMATL